MVDLIDVVLEGIKDVVDWFIGLFMDGLRSGYQTLTERDVWHSNSSDRRDVHFSENQVMPLASNQEGLIGGEIMLIALLLLVMSVQGRHTPSGSSISGCVRGSKDQRLPGSVLS